MAGGESGLPYFHIDPFKIDFAAVTKTMSSAYAERFHILPVAINTREVTIATSEPYARDWEDQIKQALRLEVKRTLRGLSTWNVFASRVEKLVY